VRSDDPCNLEKHNIEGRLLVQLLFVELHVNDAVGQVPTDQLAQLTLAHLCHTLEAIKLDLAAQVQMLVDAVNELHQFWSQLCLIKLVGYDGINALSGGSLVANDIVLSVLKHF